MTAYAAQALAKTWIRQGHEAEARDLLREALDVCSEMDDRFGQALVLRTWGEAELAADRPWLPLSASYAMVSRGGSNRLTATDYGTADMGRLVALAAWRLTKGVYWLEPDAQNAHVSRLWQAPNVPVDPTLGAERFVDTLAQHCVYVALPQGDRPTQAGPLPWQLDVFIHLVTTRTTGGRSCGSWWTRTAPGAASGRTPCCSTGQRAVNAWVTSLRSRVCRGGSLAGMVCATAGRRRR